MRAPILFFFNIAFASLGSLQFHVNLMTHFSIQLKKGEILIEIADLNSIDLSVIFRLIQEHSRSSSSFGHFNFFYPLFIVLSVQIFHRFG